MTSTVDLDILHSDDPALAGVDPEEAHRHFLGGAGLTPQQWFNVTSPPAELAGRVEALLPHAGTLSSDELAELASAIAADTDVWEPVITADPLRRRYRLLFEAEAVDVWALCWMPGQATGFHDHDLSSVGLSTARGSVVERQLRLSGVCATGRPAIDEPAAAGTPAARVMHAGGAARAGGAGYIHAVSHFDGEPAVTIHAYSPPLSRVGQYRVDTDGLLIRVALHGRQELMDHTIDSWKLDACR